MRKITCFPIVTFVALMTPSVIGGIALSIWIGRALPLGAYEPLVVVGGSYFLSLAYRLMHAISPLAPGDVEPGSWHEFHHHVYNLFFLVWFTPIMRSWLLPVYLTRFFYRAMGCTMGPNSYTAGIIYDPLLVTVGRDTLLGQGSLVVPHLMKNASLMLAPIRVGNNVTVGANAILLGGTQVADDAVVAAGAVVTAGTSIGRGELWGGVPARLLRHADGTSPSANDTHVVVADTEPCHAH
jgi:acetyltransferase-like isoleucine patch superfamily enzyme